MTHYFKEKLLFGLSSFASAGFSGLGAIMTGEEARWVYVTISVAIMCSSSLALMFRKPTESIKIVVGRCMMSVLITVFGTRVLVEATGMEAAHTDVLYLGGVATGVCVLAYTVGHGLFKSMDANSSGMGNTIRQFLLNLLKPGPK